MLTQKQVKNKHSFICDFCNFKCNYCPSFLHSGKYANGKLPGFPIYSDIIVFFEKQNYAIGIRQLQRDFKELHLLLKSDENLIKYLLV